MTIDLASGVFQEFVAVKGFHFGKLVLDVARGEKFQFDGEVLRFRKQEYHVPEFRSVIKAGWVGGPSSADTDPAPRTAPAGPATARGEAALPVSREQQEVGSVHRSPQTNLIPQVPQSSRAASLEPKPFKGALIREDDGDGRVVGSATTEEIRQQTRQGITLGAVSPQRNATNVRQASILDDSKTERVIGPVGGGRMLVTDTSSVNEQIRRLDNTGPTSIIGARKNAVVAVETDDLQDLALALDPAGRAELLQKERQREAAAATAKAAREARLAQVKADEKRIATEEGRPIVEAAPDPVAAPVAPVKVVARQPQTIEEAVVMGDDSVIAPGFTWDKKLHWRTRAKLAVKQFHPGPDDSEDVARVKNESMARVKAFEEKTVVALIDQMVAATTKAE